MRGWESYAQRRSAGVIVDPVLDVDCLARLTAIARHEIHNPLVAAYVERIEAFARRRGIELLRDAAIVWLQEQPQSDDDGRELVRAIACNPDQRTRLFPDDPNCFERALAGLILFETIDPSWQYTVASVDDPLRHTGLLMRPNASYEWAPVDLFPSSEGGGLLAWLRQAARKSSSSRKSSARRPRQAGADEAAPVDVIAGVKAWIAKLEAQNPSYAYGYDVGPVYARIWRRLGRQESRSSVAFVELATGTIRRSDSWKKAGRPFSTLDEMLATPRNIGVQDVFGVIHPVGHAVLGYFGAGAVGDYAEKYEKQYGLLKDDKKKPPPPQQQPKPAPPPAARPAPPPAGPAPVRYVAPTAPPPAPVRYVEPPAAPPPPAPPAPAPPSATEIAITTQGGGPYADEGPTQDVIFWPPRGTARARRQAQETAQRWLW
jgi:hypothetical protein